MKKILYIFILCCFMCPFNVSFAKQNVYDVCDIISNSKSERYFLIKSNNGYGVASEAGKISIIPEYSNIVKSKTDDRYLIVQKNDNENLHAVFYFEGKQITPFIESEDIQIINLDLLCFTKNGKIYTYNIDNKKLTPLSITNDFENTNIPILVPIKNNSKWGILKYNDSKAIVILSFDYDDINYLFNYLFVIKKNNKYTLFDYKNPKKKLIFYDEIKIKNNNSRRKVYVKENGKWKYLTDDHRNSNEEIIKEKTEQIILFPLNVIFGDWGYTNVPKSIKIKL